MRAASGLCSRYAWLSADKPLSISDVYKNDRQITIPIPKINTAQPASLQPGLKIGAIQPYKRGVGFRSASRLSLPTTVAYLLSDSTNDSFPRRCGVRRK